MASFVATPPDMMDFADTPPFSLLGLAPTHRLRPGSRQRIGSDSLYPHVSSPWVTPEDFVDSELAQLSAGLRDVIKSERESLSAAKDVAEVYEAFGFLTRVFSDPADRGNASAPATVFVARRLARLEEALEVERELVVDARHSGPPVERMGALLGYPDCCTESFANTRMRDDATHFARLSEAHVGKLLPEQNWTMFRLFSHLPCTPSCPKTARLGRRTFEAISEENAAYAKRLEAVLRSVAIVVSFDCCVLLPDARKVGEHAFSYAEVFSHRRIPESPVRSLPTFRAFYLEVIAPLEEGNLVRRDHDRLIVERDGSHVATITFSGAAPKLLDFTGRKARRESRRVHPPW